MSLRDKSIVGIFWSLLQNMGGRGINFIVIIVLARLLAPEMFGLIGMLMIFIIVSQTLVRAGFNQALIQKKDTDEEDYSTVFWINLAVSILIYCILYFSAPLIANFYQQPILTSLTRVLSLVFVINAFSYVQTARLRKEMEFKTLTLVHIPSTVLGGAISIIMALNGFGVWSLIALRLVTQGMYSIQIWIYARWKPLFIFNGRKARKLFSFGGKLMISSVLYNVFQNIYLVVIGKFFPLSAVGYYQYALKCVKVPSSTISRAVDRVMFSSFSLVQDNNRKLKKGIKKLNQQTLFIICPAFVLAGVLAVPLFRFVFTEKWLPAVPYFQILCVFGVMAPLHVYNMSIIKAKGQGSLILKLEITKRVLIVIGIVITVPIGIYALLIFQAINAVLMYILNGYFTDKFIGYSVLEQTKDILPVLLSSIVVGGGVVLIDGLLQHYTDIIRLIAGFGSGIIFYWLIAKATSMKPYLEIKNILANI